VIDRTAARCQGPPSTFPSSDCFGTGNGAVPVLSAARWGRRTGRASRRHRVDAAAPTASTIWSDPDVGGERHHCAHGNTPSIACRIRVGNRRVVLVVIRTAVIRAGRVTAEMDRTLLRSRYCLHTSVVVLNGARTNTMKVLGSILCALLLVILSAATPLAQGRGNSDQGRANRDEKRANANQVVAVPEPSTLVLLAASVGALGGRKIWQQRCGR
jgi:hypothetical protein